MAQAEAELELETAPAEPAPAPSRSPIAALAFTQFRLLFAGSVFANLGNWMQQFALGWLVVELAVRDGHPELAALYLGFIGLARFIPGLGIGILGGVAADRVDRRTLLLTTRTASALITAVLAALVLSGRVNLVAVMALTALNTATFGFDAPARMAVIPRLVAPGYMWSAMSITRATQHSSLLLGPFLGGILIVPIGVGGVMAVNAVLYVLSVAVLFGMEPAPVEDEHRSGSAFDSLVEGLRFVRHSPLNLWLLVYGVVFSIFLQSYQQLLPAVAHDSLHVGAVELSWMVSAAGLGALIGSTTVATLGGVRQMGWLLLGDAVLASVVIILLGIERDLVPAIVNVGVLGFTAVVFGATVGNVTQSHLPDRFRGRVIGLQVMTWQAGSPLGTVLLGTTAAFIGIGNAMIGAGAIVLLATALFALRVPVVRDVELAPGFR